MGQNEKHRSAHQCVHVMLIDGCALSEINRQFFEVFVEDGKIVADVIDQPLCCGR